VRLAHPNDLTDGKPARYTIYYPSGRSFVLTGVLCLMVLPDPNVKMSPLIREPERDNVLDPRAVIVRDGEDERLVIYEPRSRNRTLLAPWVLQWLEEHPEWPKVVMD